MKIHEAEVVSEDVQPSLVLPRTGVPRQGSAVSASFSVTSMGVRRITRIVPASIGQIDEDVHVGMKSFD